MRPISKRGKSKGFDAYIVEDTSSPAGTRMTTFLLKYPRFIHAELMTHRVFSRNASSSRAIPVKRLMRKVLDDPASPVFWGKNQRGMAARRELSGRRMQAAKFVWFKARYVALAIAWVFIKIGLHKQLANRILEPWMHIEVVVTATEFENFFKLRCHPDAQPEIKKLADMMRVAYVFSMPHELKIGEWHLPFTTPRMEMAYGLETMKKVGVARAARASYATHDGEINIEKDIQLYEKLYGANPMHASPFEHVAQALDRQYKHGNVLGYKQLRQFVEEEKRNENNSNSTQE